jgi:glucosamine 6-phosphate synthetase-like amidotransferase/phosphosugar isomerase protein
MCGIAAILLYPTKRPPEMWAAIRASFTDNLLFNEERGRKASGLAVLKKDVPATIHKSPICAHEFVEEAAYQQLLNGIDSQTTLVLGHTRQPTKGSPNNHHNNHPIQAGKVIGVHNGHINNDDLLFADCDCERLGEVDSEIIFQLLWHDLPLAFGEAGLTAVQSNLQRLQGKFVILAGDQRTPEKLLVVKENNPLSLHYHPEWQALIFSSRYIFLRKTFGRAVLKENLPGNHLFIFDADKLPQYGANAVAMLPTLN